ncbi:hypothetical protein VRRI112168_20095 [Vreelandella rituensis]|uniref:DUF7281 domain-containing protein n=1 Tax=Vreelandella rituensis TaxID=2282306 RepID=A0A368TR41_9GAMM|nr:hypothetical protein [Halomonas rituensis]RCV85703.1 hypothetical protein DU506_20815 [Halomonas rituensis]
MNATWREIHAQWGVGTPLGRHLSLTSDDLGVLRERCQRHFGGDIVAIDRSQRRSDLAGDITDEKQSRQAAFGQLIRVASTEGGVYFTPKEWAGSTVWLPTPAGTLLSLDAEGLVFDPEHMARILVIENGDLMERWWDILPTLPETWRSQTLLAYRGHQHDSAMLKRWIEKHRGHVTLGFYGDLDPAGLVIALSNYAAIVPEGKFAILAPEIPEELPSEWSKATTFSDQTAARYYLENRRALYPGWARLINTVLKQQIAITQEKLLIKAIPLVERYQG